MIMIRVGVKLNLAHGNNLIAKKGEHYILSWVTESKENILSPNLHDYLFLFYLILLRNKWENLRRVLGGGENSMGLV